MYACRVICRPKRRAHRGESAPECGTGESLRARAAQGRVRARRSMHSGESARGGLCTATEFVWRGICARRMAGEVLHRAPALYKSREV